MLSQAKLLQKLHFDPAFTEVARLVGYLGIDYPIPKAEYDRLVEEFGADRLNKAAAELLDYNTEKKIAKLKLNVRVLCRSLLGPSPEEWDSFYEGIENPPPNPYRKNPAETSREPINHAPTETPELIRGMHGRKLRHLLLSQHELLRNYPTEDPTHAEAARRADLLECEMRRRKQKIPPRPVANPAPIDARSARLQTLEGTELMRRYFKAKEILEFEDDRTGVWKQTKVEYDLLKSECLRRQINLPPTGYDDPAREFRRHTTARLNELLDMAQYEIGRYGPDTVTHQEALRDISLIECELRRRTAR